MTHRLSSTDFELRDRLAFIGLDAQTCAAIARLKPVIDAALPGALKTLYERIRLTAAAKRFFDSDAEIDRARQAQIGHWGAITAGKFDDGTFPRSAASAKRTRESASNRDGTSAATP